MVKALVTAAILLVTVASAQSVVTINFETLPDYTAPLESYSSLGVHFATGGFGVVSGISSGDPGNWGLEGTDGSKFFGFNGNGGYSMVLTFDAPIAFFSLDVSPSNGSSGTDTFTLAAFDSQNTQLTAQTIGLPTINTWQTVTLSMAGITSVKFSNNGDTFRPYGVDRIQFSATAVPEPSTLLLLGMGAVGALAVARRRRRS